MDIAPIVVSAKDAQRILAVGNSKFYQLVAEGKIRRIKIGRRSVFRLEDLHQFVDSCPADGGASVSLPGSATRASRPPAREAASTPPTEKSADSETGHTLNFDGCLVDDEDLKPVAFLKKEGRNDS